MKKWGLALMLVAIMATPMLACGFPLPAGTEMMAVSKAVCADGEAPETCQARQDAYQMMSKLQSAAVENLQVYMFFDDGESPTEVTMTGSYEYVVVEDSTGLGANVHAVLQSGELTAEGSSDSLSGMEFIIVGNQGYTTEDGGETWVYEELTSDALLGLGLLLGLGGPTGTGLDLFADPSIFSVTATEGEAMMGQAMQVQTLTVDLTAMMSNADVLAALMEQGSAAGGEELGISADELGDPAEFAMMAGMLLPFLAGSEFSTTIYIGADDGYIHRVEDNYVFTMDLSAFDPESAPVNMTYTLSGDITQHNGDIVITAPEGATEGPGFLSEEGGLFGGSGLGGSLFGG